MKIVLVLIAILAIGALIIGGCAHRYKNPEQRALYFTQKITKQLDLNDEQKARLDTLKDEILALRSEMQNKRDETHDSLRDLLNSPTLDQNRAVSIINTRVQDISDQAPRLIAVIGDFWDSLNPAQQIQLREKMEKRFKGHAHWGNSCRHPL